MESNLITTSPLRNCFCRVREWICQAQVSTWEGQAILSTPTTSLASHTQPPIGSHNKLPPQRGFPRDKNWHSVISHWRQITAWSISECDNVHTNTYWTPRGSHSTDAISDVWFTVQLKNKFHPFDKQSTKILVEYLHETIYSWTENPLGI